LPESSPFIPKLLEQFHTSPIGGHEGAFKTFKRLSSEVYWKGMRKDVVEFLKGCQVCQQNKYSTLSPAGLLQPLPIPTKVWSNISLDFIEGLPVSSGYDAVLVVVDRLSKYGHFIPLKHPYTAKSVVEVFIKEIVRLHGFPESMVSDRDKIFVSHFWSALFKSQGTHLAKSTAYHPQSDGQTEVLNRCLETYLRCFVNGKPKSWAQLFSWAEYWSNTSFHSAIKMTPFQALYGREPPKLLRFGDIPKANAVVEEMLQERDRVVTMLRENLQAAQARMQKSANKHRRELEFIVGDWVYLKLRPYRQVTVAQRRNEKLSPRFFGPYQILQKIGAVAYKLQLPSSISIHPVFHISQLKHALPSSAQAQPLPAIMTSNLEWEPEPEDVLEIRESSTGADTELLIKWRGLPECENTWEPMKVIRQQFPAFHLEDKVASLRGSNDKVETMEGEARKGDRATRKRIQRRSLTQVAKESLRKCKETLCRIQRL